MNVYGSLNSARKQTGRGVLVLGMLILGALGCRQEAPPEVTPEIPRNVRILAIEAGDLTEYFEISGPVAPVQGTNLSAEEAGAVVALNAAKGQWVEKGQLLMEQERSILKAQWDSARANLEAQSYNVDKVRKLNQAGKVSRMELLNTESVFEQAKSLVEVTRQRYERAAIRAPFAGVIVERFVELGQLVQPGQPVVRLIDPTHLKLEAYLTDSEVPWAKVGATASVELGENQGTVPGVVTWVALEADRMTGKFKLELAIDNTAGQLRSGVIGRARMPKNALTAVVTIPRDAVMHSRQGTFVFVIEGDRALRKFIKLGVDQGALVLVTQGLQSEDKLVVRGHRSLRNGSLVNITEVSTRRDGLLDGDPAALVESAEASR